MLIGASIAAENLAFYEPLFSGNDIMRIFPVDVTIGGADLKVLPRWSDSRLEYCRRKGTIPFLSCKVDGHAGGVERVRQQLEDMPAWIRDDPAMRVFITDRHEPEGDLAGGPDAYRRNFARFLAMIDDLRPQIRDKVRCGPILTQTWTENKKKGNFVYKTYDPGTGDFFGVDCYVPAGSDKKVISPAALPAPAEFLKHVKAYEFGPADKRPRIFPELGVIGMPADTDGSARAAWLQGVHDEVSTWHPKAPGWQRRWSFLGWIWWNQRGKNTGRVAVIGGRRDFALDERTVDEHTVAKLNPPKPLNTFNAIWSAQRRPAVARPHHAESLATG
ncbi:hypothetical protein QLQ12_13275 [Actinoplanes sp. NEAU-A12]|uniref:Uncharacterized protein n=1 Tax=Actinoplanes sandaracinus TaxID=3045177 RepID=A0ABT6WIL7_9ACTN|nr:hypothetical protein [Actinoplanes sandaracinus]MDI6099569.1 hypothetical protein [Actinoplanes sandaracinus]